METAVQPQESGTNNRRNFVLFIALTGLAVSIAMLIALFSLDDKLISLESKTLVNQKELLSLYQITHSAASKYTTPGEQSTTSHSPSSPSNRDVSELIPSKEALGGDSLNRDDIQNQLRIPADTIQRKDTLIIIPQNTITASQAFESISDIGRPVKILISRSDYVNQISSLVHYSSKLETQYQALLARNRRVEQELAALRDSPPKSGRPNDR